MTRRNVLSMSIQRSPLAGLRPPERSVPRPGLSQCAARLRGGLAACLGAVRTMAARDTDGDDSDTGARCRS